MVVVLCRVAVYRGLTACKFPRVQGYSMHSVTIDSALFVTYWYSIYLLILLVPLLIPCCPFRCRFASARSETINVPFLLFCLFCDWNLYHYANFTYEFSSIQTYWSTNRRLWTQPTIFLGQCNKTTCSHTAPYLPWLSTHQTSTRLTVTKSQSIIT
jgi:hypothetical protein